MSDANLGLCAHCGTDDGTCCITIGGGGPHCCEACRATAGSSHPNPEGVGTGAGEGAPGQDVGSAWVTRSADCPEAPAQAHPLDHVANLGDGANGRLNEAQRVSILHAALRDMIRSDRNDFPDLTALVERIVRTHVERAWDEGWTRGTKDMNETVRWGKTWCARPTNPYAARQEQDR